MWRLGMCGDLLLRFVKCRDDGRTICGVELVCSSGADGVQQPVEGSGVGLPETVQGQL